MAPNISFTLTQLLVATAAIFTFAFSLGLIVRSFIKGHDHTKAEQQVEWNKGYKESAEKDAKRAWQNYHEERDKHIATQKQLKEVNTVIRKLAKREGEILESVSVWRSFLTDAAHEMGVLLDGIRDKRIAEGLHEPE